MTFAAKVEMKALDGRRNELGDAIVLTPDGSKKGLGIELRGNLAAMLGGDRTNEEVARI